MAFKRPPYRKLASIYGIPVYDVIKLAKLANDLIGLHRLLRDASSPYHIAPITRK